MALPNNAPDIYLYLLSIVGAVILVLNGIVLYLLSGYVNHLNQNNNNVWERFEKLAAERLAAWRNQNEFCRMCFALLNKVVGRRNGEIKE